MRYKGIIFDLDNTLINTNTLREFRDIGNWQACYKNLHITTVICHNNTLEENFNMWGCKVGVVTNSPRTYAEKLLNYHRFTYDSLIAYHDCQKRKPFPEPMLMCTNSLEVLPEEVISIGDHVNDIIAANRAGMISIGVSWGDYNRAHLISADPNYIVDSFNELITLLNDLFGGNK